MSSVSLYVEAGRSDTGQNLEPFLIMAKLACKYTCLKQFGAALTLFQALKAETEPSHLQQTSILPSDSTV